MAFSDGLNRPKRALFHWLWNIIDAVFPPQCGGCGEWGKRWCNSCQESIHFLNGKYCQICGIPIYHEQLCAKCSSDPPAFSGLRSVAFYEGNIRKAIHSLKYHRNIGLGEVFSDALLALLCNNNWKVDGITTVPISKTRLYERGYNQANLLAYPLALASGKAWIPNAMARIREERSQVGLNAKERKLNVDGAFHANANLVSGKSILIIDDVITTGATMQACAIALLNAGADHVFGLTLARAGLIGKFYYPDTFATYDVTFNPFQTNLNGG